MGRSPPDVSPCHRALVYYLFYTVIEGRWGELGWCLGGDITDWWIDVLKHCVRDSVVTSRDSVMTSRDCVRSAIYQRALVYYIKYKWNSGKWRPQDRLCVTQNLAE